MGSSFKGSRLGAAINDTARQVAAAASILLLPYAGAATAQTTFQNSTLLVPPATAPYPDYDRGHNVSITERPRPEYDALGVRLGSFVVNPQMTVSTGYTDNVFADNLNKRSDFFVSLEPYVTAASDWSVHQVRVTAAGDIRRYAKQPLKNQEAYYLFSQGRLDVSSDLTIRFDGQIERSFESPFSDDVAANLTVPSIYLRTLAGARAVYGIGQSRVIAEVNRSSFAFDPLRFGDGSVRDQRYRDRIAYNGSLTYEVGFTPSLSFFGQLNLDANDYSTLAFGLPNRDSSGYRAVVGSNFDIAGVARGSIGVGYSVRDYKADALFRDANGLSVEARADWFASELTTVGFFLQRRLLDVSLNNAGAFWDNRFRATVDHELLYNMIVSISGELTKRDYIEFPSSTNVYAGQIGARYQASRTLGLSAEIGYGSSRPTGANLGRPFDELRARLSVRIRR